VSENDLSFSIKDNTKPSASKRLTQAVGDAFAFIRSAEANAALATVTLEQLIGDQVNRNGESQRSNSAKYDPYSYDPDKKAAASSTPLKPANIPSGSDTSRPTKLDSVLAIKNTLSDVIKEIKDLQPVDVATPTEYTDTADVAAPEDA